MTPYATVSEAATYFSERLYTAAWDSASADDKLKSLKTATRTMESLNYAGDKAVETQELQFPRGADTEIPDDVKYACAEEALALLARGADVEDPYAMGRLKRRKIGDAEDEYDTSYSSPTASVGLISHQAWRLLQPFLRDPNILDLDRS